ncbi:glycosyltransferase family 4 protein [Sutcliffiella rhizosphaerae]|uniref:Glycosyl transferase family 1 domain-containing protein n=1 Tax=Sutcliffiella rhizosphaerae TaxID=2880967 RepID=A0ABN8A8R9_9BACI|nr:glycosyltransferase family 4 protein [Sutcliffiella rhizosphaerae]CAG9620196.1 hypothetical protein BACCIP111883_00964 [Sutcliffiella rhizosphaerae]
MKKKIWIFNHYATKMFDEKAGRHFWFAEYLKKKGYEPIIFCASTIHNSHKRIRIESNYKIEEKNGIPFVIIKTPDYKGNGKQRIINMLSFYKNIIPISKEYARLNGKPDLILASSVHPLTLVAGIKLSKEFKVSCISEVRDLWPETLVAYGSISPNSLIAKFLYMGEKWIYKNSDKIIFTMPGGIDYIKGKSWDLESGGPINLKKVKYINNGVDLESFNFLKEHNKIDDEDIKNQNIFKVIYTGSISKANNVKKLVDIAKYLSDKNENHVKILIFGEGLQKKVLEEYCLKNNLQNIVFKGHVDKKYIPFILSKSNLNIFHFEQNSLKKYGASLNKMFEYFASRKPVLSDCEFGYDLIKKHNCGTVIDNGTVEQLATEVLRISKLSQIEYESYCDNAYNLAKSYDFKLLTDKLEGLFEYKNI